MRRDDTLLRTAMSPYHLTTREAPAMAALLLSDAVVTLLPSPSSDAPTLAEIASAAGALPRFAEFMRSWQWSVPLWSAGVLSSSCGGESAADEIERVCADISGESRYDALRPLMHAEWLDDRARYLDALAGDLLKGGPSPAVSVPVLAALDRLSARHGLASFRSAGKSLAQQAEARLSTRVLTCSVPILLQAEGERVLEARSVLEPELVALRAALADAAAEATLPPGDDERARFAELQADVRAAASAYTAAFERLAPELCRADDPDDDRVLPEIATLSVLRLPVDAVLRSSTSAARAYLGGRPVRGAATTTTLPVRAPDAGALSAFTVRVVGRVSGVNA